MEKLRDDYAKFQASKDADQADKPEKSEEFVLQKE
jgi:hypothetical protein